MPGHSDEPELRDVLWPDAEIQSIEIDYEELRISLLESTRQKRIVSCHGYIGHVLVGFWDEVVVERAELIGDDPFLKECVESLRLRYARDLPDTGSPARNLRTWRVLRVHLSDGAVLKVVAAQFVST